MKKILCCLLAVFIIAAGVLFFVVNRSKKAQIEEEKSTSPTYNTDVNGDIVPYFENVNASQFEPSKFVHTEDGRITYADDSVSVSTGIDVSVFQGDVDWEAVKNDGIDFVMLRAGYRGYGTAGKLGEDDNFKKNADGAHSAGLKVGAYFFSQATSVAEAIEEAEFFKDIISNSPVDFPVAFDWESIDYDNARTDEMTNEQITECAKAFCDNLSAAGYETLIYFNCESGYFNLNLSKLTDYHFWLAEYTDVPDFYYDYKIWQYTKNGKVDGVNGEVDINICLHDFLTVQAVG